jgi:FtsP/CotA-like multicopper oxidase with cupredoxin domain
MVCIGMLYFSLMFLCLRCHQGLVRMTVQGLPVVGKKLPTHLMYHQTLTEAIAALGNATADIPCSYVRWRVINSSNMAGEFIRRDRVRLRIWNSRRRVLHYLLKPKNLLKLISGSG